MSHARRTAEALEAARENTTAAVTAAGLHHHRAERDTLPQHIKNLEALVESTAALYGISTDLAAVAKTCADTVRTHYVRGINPDSGDWPQPLRDAAADADRALSKLRVHLARTSPTHAAHDALSVLHGFLRDVHRVASPR